MRWKHTGRRVRTHRTVRHVAPLLLLSFVACGQIFGIGEAPLGDRGATAAGGRSDKSGGVAGSLPTSGRTAGGGDSGADPGSGGATGGDDTTGGTGHAAGSGAGIGGESAANGGESGGGASGAGMRSAGAGGGAGE